MPLEHFGPAPGHGRRRGLASLFKRLSTFECEQVPAGQSAHGDHDRGREPGDPPPAALPLQLLQTVDELE